MSFPGKLADRLLDVAEDATTSIGADLAELSEGSEDTTVVEHPDVEDEEEEVVVPGEEEEEEEVTSEEEEDEEEEVEDEPEEVPENIADLHPFNRPSLKSIEEKFPGFFKAFPAMRDMYFRESEYSKLFPTVDDAKEANENDTAFKTMRESIFNGNGSKLFSAIKEVNEKDLEKFSQTILPTLFQVHPPAFWRVANPFVEDIARRMFEKGTKENNESLQNAARYLSDYFFGNVEIAEGKKTSITKIEGTDPEVSKERENFEKEKQTTFANSVEADIRGKLLSMIEGVDPKTGKSRLDPDGVFSPFIKRTIIQSIIDELGSQLLSDKSHIKFMDSLWDKSKKNGRTDTDKSRIISAYLERAKSLVPTLRSKFVSEALGQKVRISSGNKKKVEASSSRVDAGSHGRGSNGRDKSYNPKSINYNKTSDADILNDNITYK
jgi:hypothetical protein